MDIYEAIEKRRTIRKFKGQATEEQNRRTAADTLFVSLELQKLSEEDAQRYLSSPELEPYRHFIRKQRLLAPYTLSEPEEKVLQKKTNG